MQWIDKVVGSWASWKVRFAAFIAGVVGLFVVNSFADDAMSFAGRALKLFSYLGTPWWGLIALFLIGYLIWSGIKDIIAADDARQAAADAQRAADLAQQAVAQRDLATVLFAKIDDILSAERKQQAASIVAARLRNIGAAKAMVEQMSDHYGKINPKASNAARNIATVDRFLFRSLPSIDEQVKQSIADGLTYEHLKDPSVTEAAIRTRRETLAIARVVLGAHHEVAQQEYDALAAAIAGLAADPVQPAS